MDPWERLRNMVKGTLLENEPLSSHTSYGIGGPAQALVTPRDRDDLAAILRWARRHRIRAHFIGSGSNLLVSDQGVQGIVITLGRAFARLEIKPPRVRAESGVMLGHLVKECFKRNLSGMESLIGVPGTLGGALVMNAGAFGSEISTHLIDVEVMTMAGELLYHRRDELEFGYRRSSFKADEILLSANFELPPGDPETIQRQRTAASQARKTTQPLRFRSAGSIFKNPTPELAAGYLIDQAGLKGCSRGDAEISAQHANFFINHGRARASEVAALIRLARKRVHQKFGIRLELEISTLGFEPEALEA